MQFTAIVQARSNSKRLKNKMFANLDNHKILEWVLFRIKKSKLINKFIVATSKNNEKSLIKIARKSGYKIFTGDENDVLKRYYECAKKNKSKNIIRVCADNPFIDPVMIDGLISFFKNSKIDYAFNNMKIRNNLNADGFGAEIFTYEALKKANAISKSKNEREHVTGIFRKKKNLFLSKIYPSKYGINFPYLKFDINTEADLKKIKKFVNNSKINMRTSAQKIVKKHLSNEIGNILKEMFPLNRSLTGNGNLATLKKLKKITPIKIKKIPSGTKVYDWKVPYEWFIKDAWIKDSKNNKIVDFKKNNLNLVGYSTRFNGYISPKKLIKKLHFSEKLPNAIPYKTSYFKRDWGFCVEKKVFDFIKSSKKKFQVKIDSKFKKGNLIYGEILIKGKSKKEILISTYICHPSMANDNLSGVILTSYLAKFIKSIKNRYWSYRIVFLPETIGAISYCKINENKMKQIDLGLVVTNVGGKGDFSYKQSYESDHFINKIVNELFKELKLKNKKYPFDINGSDERQYSSQFFGINICSVFKDKYYEFKEYHTSKDNLKFVKPENIFETLKIYHKLIEKIEKQVIYKSNISKCEPMLSKYNLYPKLGGGILPKKKLSNIDITLWILFLSNGKRTLDQIAEFLNLNQDKILKLYKNFEKKNLVHRV